MSEKVAQFKIGDIVKIVKNECRSINSIGDVGIITQIKGNGRHIRVFVEKRGYLHGTCNYPSDLILRCKNTRLARKLYPKAEVTEDGEWIYV